MTDDTTKELGALSTDEKLDLLINLVTDTRARQVRLEDRMTALEDRMTALEDRMTALEESVRDQFAALRAHQTEQFTQLRSSLRMLERKIEVVHQDNLSWRAELREVNDRLDRLEAA